jgi:hypothetical protein
MLGLMSRITFYRKAITAIFLMPRDNGILGWFTLIRSRNVPDLARLALAAMARLPIDLGAPAS